MQRGRGRWENRGRFSFFMTGLWFTVYDLWFLVYCARSIKYIYRHHILHQQGEREEGGGGCGWAQAVKYDQVFQIKDKDSYNAKLWFSSTKSWNQKGTWFMVAFGQFLSCMFNILANSSVREEAEASSPFRAVQVHMVASYLEKFTGITYVWRLCVFSANS